MPTKNPKSDKSEEKKKNDDTIGVIALIIVFILIYINYRLVMFLWERYESQRIPAKIVGVFGIGLLLCSEMFFIIGLVKGNDEIPPKIIINHVTITSNTGAKIYAEPSNKAKLLIKAPKKQNFLLVAQMGDWYKIETNDKISGFVQKSLSSTYEEYRYLPKEYNGYLDRQMRKWSIVCLVPGIIFYIIGPFIFRFSDDSYKQSTLKKTKKSSKKRKAKKQVKENGDS